LSKMRRVVLFVLIALSAACAGVNRSCSSWGASNFGADWVVVQYRMDGTAFNCWKLESVAIDNESNTDGIYWKDSATNHLVHISGWYNRVQVTMKQFADAAPLVGVDIAQCGNGKYPTTAKTNPQ